MSLLPLAVSIALCLLFSCVVFVLRDQARRPAPAALPARPGESARPDGSRRPA